MAESEYLSVPQDSQNDQHDRQQVEGTKVLEKPANSSLSFIVDGLLCVLALLFIALCFVVVAMKGTPTGGSLGSTVEEVMKVGPTVYPILFAALMSRSLKSIGRYCAQNGVQLSTLWTLMNSKSVFEPVLNLKVLPGPLLSWVLLFLWILSPLGGQASLRLMMKTNLTSASTRELRYFDNGPLANAFMWNEERGGVVDADGGKDFHPSRDAYIASLMQSIGTKQSLRDVWGNVKIPRLDALVSSQIDQHGWITVHNLSQVESYTSLFGLPVIGLESLGQGTVKFSVETSYVGLACDRVDTSQLTTLEPYGLNYTCVDCSGNTDARWWALLGPPLPGLSPSQAANPKYANARTIKFQSVDESSMATVDCLVYQRLVETAIECDDAICAATKMRNSTTDHRGSNFTHFDNLYGFIFQGMTAASKAASGQVAMGSSSSEIFLNDPSVIPIHTGLEWGEQTVNLSFVPPDTFARRASMLLNTGIQAYMAPTGFAGNLSQDLSLYGAPHIPADGLITFANESVWEFLGNAVPALFPGNELHQISSFIGASTNATVVDYQEVYEPVYAWVVILFLSSIIVSLIGIVGLYVSFYTIVPNIFDSVMGLTYDSPYIPVPAGAPLDVEERVKELGKLKVRLGSVQDEDGKHKLALGLASTVKQAQEGKFYT